MRERIASHWWLFLIRGILALLLGIAVPFFPIASLFVIAILFGVYCWLDGVVALVSAFRMSHADGRWVWLLLEGLVGLAAGTFAVFEPGVAILALSWLLGAWALITGFLAIGSAFSARRHIENDWLWVLGGVLSVVFGVAVFFSPILAAWAMIYLFSLYAIMAGFVFIFLANRLRKMHGSAAPPNAIPV